MPHTELWLHISVYTLKQTADRQCPPHRRPLLKEVLYALRRRGYVYIHSDAACLVSPASLVNKPMPSPTLCCD